MSSDTLFLFEYASCGAFPELEPSLSIEGIAMFMTLLEGFQSFTKVKTFIDERVPFFPDYPTVENHDSLFDDYLSVADFSLLIAPETDLELYNFTKRLEKSSSANLGSNSNAVLKASDKYLTYKELKGVNTPKTEVFKGHTTMDFSLVAKPRDGVSSEGIFMVKSESDLEKVPEGYLLQEYVVGKACSASLLVNEDIVLLSLNSQEMTDFVYTGAKVPIPVDDLEEIFKAVDRINGLFGYVGIDFILNNEGISIIEINPRPTTPIVAFNEVYDINLAELILKNYYRESISPPTARKTIHMKKVPTVRSKSLVQFQGYSILLEEDG